MEILPVIVFLGVLVFFLFSVLKSEKKRADEIKKYRNDLLGYVRLISEKLSND